MPGQTGAADSAVADVSAADAAAALSPPSTAASAAVSWAPVLRWPGGEDARPGRPQPNTYRAL
eukprot:9890864-Lingulodinium_polyedra.AAC.1